MYSWEGTTTMQMNFQMKLKEILETLRLLPLTLIFFIMDTIVILLFFIPIDCLSFLGLLEFRESYRRELGLAVLILSVTWMVVFCFKIVNWWHHRNMYRGTDARRRLNQVSDWGKALIGLLYESSSRSLKLSLKNANVKLMLDLEILASAKLGSVSGVECILQPWVVEFLGKNKKYLENCQKNKHLIKFDWKNDVL